MATDTAIATSEATAVLQVTIEPANTVPSKLLVRLEAAEDVIARIENSNAYKLGAGSVVDEVDFHKRDDGLIELYAASRGKAHAFLKRIIKENGISANLCEDALSAEMKKLGMEL